MRKVYKIGDKYNFFTLIESRGKDASGSIIWLCKCACGVEKELVASRVVDGSPKSCGCDRNRLAAQRKYIHGMRESSEYLSWSKARARCANPNNNRYNLYGVRGIMMAPKWDDFRKFFEDMGPRPKGTSLDRIDNDGDYAPGNCRWATAREQSRNRGNNRYVTVNYRKQLVTDAEKQLGLHRSSISQRAKKIGETYQQATDHFVKRCMAKNIASVARSRSLLTKTIVKIAGGSPQ